MRFVLHILILNVDKKVDFITFSDKTFEIFTYVHFIHHLVHTCTTGHRCFVKNNRQFEVKGLLVEMLQQDLCSFVIPDAAQLQFYGLQRRLYLSSHRLIATIQEAAHTH